MAKKVRVELNRSAVKEMLQSPEMMRICEEYAAATLSRLGSGYEVNSRVGKTRVNAEVEAVSFEAKRDNSKNNSILKALRGG